MHRKFFDPLGTSLTLKRISFSGRKSSGPRVSRIWGADIQVSPDLKIRDGILFVKDGKIEKVAKNIEISPTYREWNCSGKTIYPGFIDPYILIGKESPSLLSLGHQQTVLAQSHLKFFGLPENSDAQTESKFGIPGVHPEKQLLDSPAIKEKKWKEFRKYGFTSAHLAPSQGIFRGTGPCILLHDKFDQQMILKDAVAQVIAFDPVGRKSSPSIYPNSLMGVLSAIRQTLLETIHAREMLSFEKTNPSTKPFYVHDGMRSLLQNLGPTHSSPTWFETGSMSMNAKATEIAKEFDLQDITLILSGDEWRRPDLSVPRRRDCILPLNFPSIPNLPQDDDWEQISLDQLRAWDNAPKLAALVAGKSRSLSFTTSGCDVSEFHKNLLKCIANGLSEKDALASLTINPANLCGISDFTGTLEKGKMANFFIIDGPSYFVASPQVHSTWIEGVRKIIVNQKLIDKNETRNCLNKLTHKNSLLIK